MAVTDGNALPWFEDPAIEGVHCERDLILSPEQQRCEYCASKDPPCVTPFMSNLYPYKIFCSADCIQREWQSQNLQPYHSVVSKVELLDIETKTELFDTAIKLRVKNGEDSKEIIERIKKVDHSIGSRFFKRAILSKSSIVRMAHLGHAKRHSGDPSVIELQDPSLGARNIARSRIKQISRQLEIPQVPTDVELVTTADEGQQRRTFIAVSYCWHNPDWNLSPSLLDTSTDSESHTLPISQKMLDAVSFLRRDESEPIWLDQLCINQTDPVEQRRAVANMDIIYSAARLVAILLEDVELTREELRVWRLLRERSRSHKKQGSNSSFNVDIETSAIVIATLSKICSARWITRAWCVHEYLLSKKYVFLIPCGGSIVLISPMVLQRAIAHRWGIPFILDSRRYSANWFRFTCNFDTDRKLKSVMDLLDFLQSRDARFLTDKLLILLNLYGKNLAYDGTPMSQDEFCYICIVLSLAEGDIASLCNSGPQLQLFRSKLKKSWARWPCDNRYFDGGLVPHTGTFKVVSPYEIKVDLYFLLGAAVRPTTKSIEISRELFQLEDIPAMIRSVTVGSRRTSQHFIEALAAGLDCGFEWITSVSSTIYEDIGVHRWTGLDSAFRDNRSSAGRVASLLVKRSGLALPKDLDATIAMEQIFKYVLLVLAYELPLEGTVLMAKSGMPVASTVGPPGTVLAVPKDLAHGKYIGQNRLWFLEPTEGPRGLHWKIAHKGMLFSPIGLSEELGRVSLQNGQSITG